MAKCKYCNEIDLKWYKDSATQRFSLIYADGTVHRCQVQQRQPQQVQQVQPPQQAAKQITTTEIDRRLADISANNLSLIEQVRKLTELYNDIMQYLVETTHAAKESAEAAKKTLGVIDEINHLLSAYISGVELRKQDIDPEEERKAHQEAEYDKDKEDGITQ